MFRPKLRNVDLWKVACNSSLDLPNHPLGRASSRIIKHLVLWEVDNIVFTECRTKRRVNINGEVCPEDIYENVNSKDRAASRCGSVMGCWQAVV
ncbi:hypothetical protein GLOIN_2v1880014 [Rhizophagus irregularis DAOM 181602=DAOM 197198]|nr:hypothetical protein GLOIN_2v1880014 [Rhizophagus irregularis DAOM 181602=DAOM 197198]